MMFIVVQGYYQHCQFQRSIFTGAVNMIGWLPYIVVLFNKRSLRDKHLADDTAEWENYTL